MFAVFVNQTFESKRISTQNTRDKSVINTDFFSFLIIDFTSVSYSYWKICWFVDLPKRN